VLSRDLPRTAFFVLASRDAAFTRLLLVGFRAEMLPGLAGAFLSRASAEARSRVAAVRAPDVARAGLRTVFVLAEPFAAAFTVDRLVRGMEAVRAFLALGCVCRFAVAPLRRDLAADLAATTLVLRLFFFTDDIRGALLCGSALETEQRGNNLLPIQYGQSDVSDRLTAYMEIIRGGARLSTP
jgi:hypothetical protein